jgi:ComF family protein
MQWFKSFGNSLLNLTKDALWQANCPLCKRPADFILCKDCDRQIIACQSPAFLQTDHPIAPEIPLYSWGIYDGALKRAIAACKYENHPEIMDAIAIKIVDQWQRSLDTKSFTQKSEKLMVIPIPLHDNKLKSRGFNQAEILARRFCTLTALPCHPQLLRRIKDTKPQMQTRSKQERAQNLASAFAISAPHSSRTGKLRSVILFDDIYTTGTTIREAIATFAVSKIAVRGVIVLARTGQRELSLN